MVGIGASAGGLDSFRELLEHLPSDSGLAFVLIQHLDPSSDSILAHILAGATRMPVEQLALETKVAPDHVYIIPPQHDIEMADGEVQLVPREERGTPHMPIDRFFRALAAARRHRSIGVVLSGTGTDGTLGLRAIKEQGGLCLAQRPETAAYRGMPESAVASGAVDAALSIREIAIELGRLGRHPYLLRPSPRDDVRREEPGEREPLDRLLAALRRATGTDFQSYKKGTLLRRIARRMALGRIDSLAQYARHAESDPEELQRLHRDCLINVTGFFRDPEAYASLEQEVLPRLLEERKARGPLRVWVAGCSTGEEVYSLAIACVEQAERIEDGPAVQIFATDLGEEVIAKARAGRYPENVSADLSPERLLRHFTRIDGQVQVNKRIRELCVFSRHDLGRDPPFSNLDLISCRNVLIYLEPALQETILRSFHYALRVPGFLFLGSSESVPPAAHLFDVVDRKHKIYQRERGGLPASFAAPPGGRAMPLPSRAVPAVLPLRAAPLPEAERILLSRYSPASVLVDGELKVLQFRGDTHPFLEHGQGVATLDLVRMARRGLLAGLKKAIAAARRDGVISRVEGLRVRYLGGIRPVSVEAIPLGARGGADRPLLVVFETPESQRPRAGPAVQLRKDEKDRLIAQLNDELAETAQYLQSVVQEQEAASEELQASHEEMLSSNEELQSVNEELETAKEELQSVNEELTTLNQELQDRNTQLGRTNDDLLNLLDSIDMPVLIVGPRLEIRKWTPAAQQLLNLRPDDLGRPFGDLHSNLDVVDLPELLAGAVGAVRETERDVRDRQGRWYRMRVRPYRTREARVDGAMLLLWDISARKSREVDVQRLLDSHIAVLDGLREPLLILDPELRVVRAGPAFYGLFRTAPEDTVGSLIHELGDGQWDIPELRLALQEVAAGRRSLDEFIVTQAFPGIGRRSISLHARRIEDPTEGRVRILLGIEDRTQAERKIRERETLIDLEQTARKRVEEVDRLKDEFIATVSHELRGPLNALAGWSQLLRVAPLDETGRLRALSAIDRSVQAQSRLIDDLLDLSRMTTGKLRLSRRPVDLRSIVDSVIRAISMAALAKQLHIEVEHPRQPVRLIGDADRLQQVVWNLVSNAVKFTPPGGRVEVSMFRLEQHLEIRVKDSGKGIAPEFLPYVFERFRQAEVGTTRPQQGLGLGLAISRHLVELHGGTIEVSCEGLGKGTTFRVYLPTLALDPGEGPDPADRAEDDPRKASPARGIESTALGGLRVLLVEDDEENREAIAVLLSTCGAAVTAVASAREALAALETPGCALPHVLVSDIGMPGMDGYELLRAVRALPPERGGSVPALALTAYTDEQDRLLAFSAGFQEHLGKPVVPFDLVATLRRLAGPMERAEGGAES